MDEREETLADGSGIMVEGMKSSGQVVGLLDKRIYRRKVLQRSKGVEWFCDEGKIFVDVLNKQFGKDLSHQGGGG